MEKSREICYAATETLKVLVVGTHFTAVLDETIFVGWTLKISIFVDLIYAYCNPSRCVQLRYNQISNQGVSHCSC